MTTQKNNRTPGQNHPGEKLPGCQKHPGGQQPYKGLSGSGCLVRLSREKKSVRVSGKPKIVQRTLFDARPVPTVKPNWKAPKHRNADDPTWFYTWQAPATENLALRRKVFGY